MPGGNLCVLDLKTGNVTDLVPELTGVCLQPLRPSLSMPMALSSSGNAPRNKAIASMKSSSIRRRAGRRGKLRQLTFPRQDESELARLYRARPHYHHGTDDMNPCYLPDGGICLHFDALSVRHFV